MFSYVKNSIVGRPLHFEHSLLRISLTRDKKANYERRVGYRFESCPDYHSRQRIGSKHHERLSLKRNSRA